MRVLLVLLALSLVTGASAEPARVPKRAVPLNGPVDVDELLRLARVSQAINATTYFLYSFRQTSRMEELDEDGQTKRTETKVYRVVPSRQGTIRHLLESDGQEPSAREVKKQLARNEKLRKRWEKIRKKQEAANAKKRAELGLEEPDRPTPTARQPEAARPPATTSSGEVPARTGAAEPDQRAESADAERPPLAAAPAPPAAESPPRPSGLAHAEAAADLAKLPSCDLDEPAASVRAPLPGSTTRSRGQLGTASAAARKARNSTGDYTIFELLSLTEYEYLGACSYEERAVHVLAFRPSEDFDPQNPVERVVTAMEGTIFVDAADVQVMRTEGRTIAPIKWGAGMVALRSAHVLFEASKVNDEVWLPTADIFEFDSRVFFDRDRQRFHNYYDDYKKLSVSTTEEFDGVVETPAPDQG